MRAPVPRRTDDGPTTRTEHDLLGAREVPVDAYWGIHTLRAKENFPISGTPLSAHPDLVAALAAVKEAAAEANRDLGLLDPRKADAIAAACREIRAGGLHDQFVVDVIQGGAGTSTNMNANEVIANRALELIGGERGEYEVVHPNEHVNLCQSTNDVYPTAVRIALCGAAAGLGEAMTVLRRSFESKAAEYDDAIKVGRTQLQDAVPLTLGRELKTYAVMLAEDEQRLAEATTLLHEINLGGTAVGTGLAAHPGYVERACAYLARITNLPLVTAPDLIEATQDAGVYVQVSGVAKRIAVKLSKTCNDLRLLSSGPRSGFAELTLPAVQAGSSIMPGKVNPVIPEVVNQIAFEAIGNDATVTMASEAGQLQLNAFGPIIAHKLLDTFAHLRAGCTVLEERCIRDLSADREQLRRVVEHSIGIATALNPAIGYVAATALACEALETGRGVRELVLERGLLPAEQVAELLDLSAIGGRDPA